MRIAFAGTPPFAAVALRALIDAGHEVALVLTQPDRPSGRGMKLTASAVKSLALTADIPVLQPETLSLKKDEQQAQSALSALEAADVDVLVVAAYGLILPQRALDAAKGIGAARDIKSINIHASLLPRWRGAAPILRAIEAGDDQTGITLMKMEAGLDTGPMITRASLAITSTHTAGSLTEELSEIGAHLIVKALSQAGELTYEQQPETGVSYAQKVQKSESPIIWNQPAEIVARRIRAFNPFPGSRVECKTHTPFKVWMAHAVNTCTGLPGEVLECSPDGLIIACASGAICCTKLQKSGKPIMDAGAFLQSTGLTVGEILE